MANRRRAVEAKAGEAQGPLCGSRDIHTPHTAATFISIIIAAAVCASALTVALDAINEVPVTKNIAAVFSHASSAALAAA